MPPVVENYWGIPGYVIFWVLFAITLGLFMQRAFLLIRLLRLGKPENRSQRLAYRIISAAAIFFTQSGNFKSFTFKDPAAIGHALMFWGLFIFGFAYFVFLGLGAGFGLYTFMEGSSFETVLLSILDIVALLVILSMVWVVIKRYIIIPERLKREQDTYEKVVQPLLIITIFSLMVLHFGIEGFRYAGYGTSSPGPLLSLPLAQAIVNAGIAQDTSIIVYKILWWINYLLLLGAIIYSPRSKHLHPLTSFANLVFRQVTPKGALKAIDLKKGGAAGAKEIRDFTWKQLLDFYSCTWCGRCHVVCPAQLSGKPLSPRELILGMKDHLLKAGPELLKAKTPAVSGISPKTDVSAVESPEESSSQSKTLVGNVISEEAIWSCTTCLACQEVCPVNNEHLDKIIDLRRHLQMVAKTEIARTPLKNLRVRGNPWQGTRFARSDWAKDLNIKIVGKDSNIEVLFWVGCTEALEDRSLKVAQAVAKLMQQANINFGILGEEEMCCGDPARRLGAEHLFQMMAVKNIQILKKYNITNIVTACPHCFNSLKNEYPQVGGQFSVIHHTQLISDLIKEKKLKMNLPNSAKITFQDPCYLGRYHGLYQPSRQIINSIPGVTFTEMEKNKQNGFCCGGGGGRMWIEENSEQGIGEMRLEQAIETHAQIVATACPFCLQMLEDASKEKEVEDSIKIKDVAELAAESLMTSQNLVESGTPGNSK